MSVWSILWIGAVLFLILWWELKVLVPGILLLATVYVLTQQGGGDWFITLLGVALVPVLGGVALALGFFRIRFETLADSKPPLATRLLAVFGVAAAAGFLPLGKLQVYLPEALLSPTSLRLLVFLVFSGVAFLGLAELPVFKGFGFLLLLLAGNIIMQNAYGNSTSFMLLVNVLELCTILLLSRQALRLPMWLSWRQREAPG